MSSKQPDRAVALGYFDGLHIAHLRVLDAAREGAKEKDLVPGVLLFDRPPAEVVTGVAVPRLMTDADRDETLRDWGFELLNAAFASIRELSPEAFVSQILCKKLGAKLVSCGYNYRFGKGGAGDAAALGALCAARGIETRVVTERDLFGAPVSSSRIRSLVEEGRLEEAGALLGRPLRFSAPVFRGDRRGRLLGTPTINQYLPAGFVTPRFGVYVSEVLLDGKAYRAVTNVGSRPTFGEGSVRSETYILGFEGDLYGRAPRLSLLKFLRPEMKFPSVEELKAQITRDAAAAAEYEKTI